MGLLTSEDGDDGLVDSRHLLLLQHVAGEEGDDEQHDGYEQSPCCEQFFLRRVALYSDVSYLSQRCLATRLYLRGRIPQSPGLCSVRQSRGAYRGSLDRHTKELEAHGDEFGRRPNGGVGRESHGVGADVVELRVGPRGWGNGRGVVYMRQMSERTDGSSCVSHANGVASTMN